LGVAATNIMYSKHDLNVFNPEGDIDIAIAGYITSVVKQIVAILTEKFSLSNKECPRYDKPVNIYLSGGLLNNESIAELFIEHLAKRELSFPVNEIKVSDNPDHGTAIGCLLVAAYDSGDLSGLDPVEVEISKDLTKHEINSNIVED
jgi:activator of 2-hydroxyglutaryl-CoA dehydratase